MLPHNRPPEIVRLSAEMKAVVGEFAFKLAVLVLERGGNVHPCDIFCGGEFFEHGIDLVDVGIVECVVTHVVRDREYALEVEFGVRTLIFHSVDDLGDVVVHGLYVGAAPCEVVCADHEEDFRGFALGDLVETCQHAPCGVSADSAVGDLRASGEFAPFAAVGDAVAEKAYFALGIGERAELGCFVLPVCAVYYFMAGCLCENCCGQKHNENERCWGEDAFRHSVISLIGW